MEFFEHARAKGIPILAIQEDGLKPGERDYFIDVSISITTACLTGPAGSAIRTHGEVIILVKANLRCHLINQLSEDEGQVVTVMVEILPCLICINPRKKADCLQHATYSKSCSPCHLAHHGSALGTLMIALMKMFCFSKMNQSDCSVVLSKTHKATLFRPDGRVTDAATMTTQSQTLCTMYSTCTMTLKPFQTIKPFAVVFSFQLPSQPRLAPLFRLARHDDLPKPDSCSLEDCQSACCEFCLQTQHRRSQPTAHNSPLMSTGPDSVTTSN